MADETTLLLEMIRSLEARVGRLERPAGTSTERMRALRQRRRDQGVTRNVTNSDAGVTRTVTSDLEGVTQSVTLQSKDMLTVESPPLKGGTSNGKKATVRPGALKA